MRVCRRRRTDSLRYDPFDDIGYQAIEVASRVMEKAGKVLFPDCGLTKADVAAYYHDVAGLMLPHMEGRFLTLHRFPDGITREGFYQQNRPEYFPDCVRGQSAPRAQGGESITHIMVDNEPALLYLAGQATIAFHGWLSRFDRPRCPDRMVFDLDPPDDDFRPVIACARLLRASLESGGLRPFVMTTGSRGVHVVVPLDRSLDFERVRQLARRIAEAVLGEDPGRYTLEQRKERRRGRLYVDIGRNAYGQTAVLPYSLRGRPGAPVATPLDWDELGRQDLSPRRFALGNIRRRLAQKQDPWRHFFSTRRRPALEDASGD